MEERPKWLGFLRQKDLTRISGHNDKNRSRKLAEGFQFALISLKQHIQQHMNFIDHNDPKLDLLQWNETRDTYTVEALRVIATTHDCLSRSKYMAPPINIDNNSLMNMPNYHEKQSRSNHGIILGDMLQNAEVFTPGLFKRGDDCLTVCYIYHDDKMLYRVCFCWLWI